MWCRLRKIVIDGSGTRRACYKSFSYPTRALRVVLLGDFLIFWQKHILDIIFIAEPVAGSRIPVLFVATSRDSHDECISIRAENGSSFTCNLSVRNRKTLYFAEIYCPMMKEKLSLFCESLLFVKSLSVDCQIGARNINKTRLAESPANHRAMLLAHEKKRTIKTYGENKV